MTPETGAYLGSYWSRGYAEGTPWCRSPLTVRPEGSQPGKRLLVGRARDGVLGATVALDTLHAAAEKQEDNSASHHGGFSTRATCKLYFKKHVPNYTETTNQVLGN